MSAVDEDSGQLRDLLRDLPIGLFDSGVGGLTVLRELRAALPGENFLYLGDTARVPYGTRSAETVIRYARQATRLLARRKIKALVIACNTASAVALDALRQEYPDMLVEGVVEPGAAAAVKASVRGSIAVIGTEGTINGGAYTRAVRQASPTAEVSGRACPLLVALAEEGWTEGVVVEAALARYFKDFFPAEGPDALVLGCTHFPVLKDAIRAAVPSHVRIVDSAETTARVVAEDLRSRGLQRDAGKPGRAHGDVHFLVTDNPARFCNTAERFLGSRPAASNIELVDITDA